MPKNVLSIHLVVQRKEPKARFSLRFGMERRLQLLNTRRSYQLPNLPFLAASYARLELRSLPSISVTRLRRYYEPLRHPVAPGLSLAGVRLIVVSDRAIGLPVLHRSSPCMHAVATTPAEPLGALFARFPRDNSLPRILSGSASASPFSRLAQRSLTLRPAYSPSPLQDPLHRRLQPLRYLHDCSDYYRLERQLPGGVRTHCKDRAFARRTKN
jgi:hypothetical protein